jgi:hypothetical protein
MTTYSWVGPVGNDLWSNANNWTPGGGPPQSADTAVIGASGYSVDINGTSGVGTLDLGFSLFGTPIADTLTVDNGANFDVDAASNIFSGTLASDTGGTLFFNFTGTFTNDSTLLVGQILSGAGGNSNLEIDGSVTLSGSGTLDLGQVSNSFQAASTGTIENFPSTSDTLINTNNTITGGGLISVSTFDNQANGFVDASQSEQFALQISSGTFTNEGLMTAESRSTLQLGQDGATRSLTNTGSVAIDSQGELAISGNFTVSGSGGIAIKGAGGDITSDGTAAATFTNTSGIEAFASGQIGDVGILGVNDLTFNNSGGTVGVTGSGDVLTLNTGSHTITDNGGTGLFEAQGGGQIVIDSNVNTGGQQFFLGGHLVGGGGTIEAAGGGVVTVKSAIAPGGSGLLFQSGDVLIAGGTVDFAAGASDTTPITFSGTGGTLEVDSAADPLGTISGATLGDSIDTRFLPFSSGVTAVWVENGSDTGGTLTVTNGSSSMTFNLSGSYAQSSFGLTSDASGGTLIEFLPPPTSDFTGAGTSDVVLQNGGTVVDWIMSNGLYSTGNVLTTGATGYSVVGTGDFTGNSVADILLQNGGTVVDWIIQNGQYSSGNVLTSAATGYSVVGTGDFTGNGTDDVLLQNSGTVVDWIMSNGQYQSGNVLTAGATGYTVVGTGDFTGNGTDDILLQNGGTVVDWLIQNGQYQSGNVLTTGATGWTVVGTGDFSNNGISDVLLQNGGTVVDWIMKNGQYQSGNVITTAATGYTVVGTGDYNGDGTSDVLLQNGGTVVDWIMKNGQYQSGNVITTAATGYNVAHG